MVVGLEGALKGKAPLAEKAVEGLTSHEMGTVPVTSALAAIPDVVPSDKSDVATGFA